MITELYKDVETLEAINEKLHNVNTDNIIIQIKQSRKLISDMIKEKNQEIGKIQDEHNRRSLEDLLGRKI